MKRLTLTTLAALVLLAAPLARAWNYNPGDLLLVFRNGAQDVEFDLGSVTNFLGQTNGYTTTVTGWDLGLVTSTFGSLNGVSMALLATGGTTNWLSSAEPNTTAYNGSSQAANILNSVISAVGTKPANLFNVPSNSVNAYSIDATPSGQYYHASYDYIVSGGNGGIPQWDGNAPFTVEQSIPGFLDFWQVQATTIYPNPPPDTLIGTFTINASGGLTFVAGPRPATITSVTHGGNTSQVKFTTTVGNTYSLAYTNQLGGAPSTWPVDAATVVGNGKANTITHAATGAVEFYRVGTH